MINGKVWIFKSSEKYNELGPWTALKPRQYLHAMHCGGCVCEAGRCYILNKMNINKSINK